MIAYTSQIGPLWVTAVVTVSFGTLQGSLIEHLYLADKRVWVAEAWQMRGLRVIYGWS